MTPSPRLPVQAAVLAGVRVGSAQLGASKQPHSILTVQRVQGVTTGNQRSEVRGQGAERVEVMSLSCPVLKLTSAKSSFSCWRHCQCLSINMADMRVQVKPEDTDAPWWLAAASHETNFCLCGPKSLMTVCVQSIYRLYGHDILWPQTVAQREETL